MGDGGSKKDGKMMVTVEVGRGRRMDHDRLDHWTVGMALLPHELLRLHDVSQSYIYFIYN